MTPNPFPNLILNASEAPLVTCTSCDGMMVISLIEPAAPGFEIRTYKCNWCEAEEQFVVQL